MLTTDRVAGGALALIALVVLWESRKLPLGSLRTPGPAYTPMVLAAILLVFGTLLVVTGGRASAFRSVGWAEWRHAVAIFAACAFAALALERLGYRVTVTVALAFLLGVLERKGIVFTVVFSLALAIGSFLLFDTLLRVPLPRGPFGL
ncbi:MAG: tripartite tricarboxylate transporter TctB family protein [Candidatus Rokubacteria bacterium]|nr:tripartite tricarboxylate transporter TctB family protein [Candidatus Rokubacteria bacterium]